jgi:hypothetical protein
MFASVNYALRGGTPTLIHVSGPVAQNPERFSGFPTVPILFSGCIAGKKLANCEEFGYFSFDRAVK